MFSCEFSLAPYVDWGQHPVWGFRPRAGVKGRTGNQGANVMRFITILAVARSTLFSTGLALRALIAGTQKALTRF
jgi:hypothetical protein